MKTKKILILFLVLAILTGCSDYLNINSDPRFPQEAPAEILLPPVFQEMARGEMFDSRFFGCYVQNWAFTTSNFYGDLHGYLAGSDNIGEKWRQHYWAIGKNIDLIVTDAVANEKWWYAGAALAIRAWSWQTSTDVYGEMILKQAWEPNRYIFDYDSQDLIYEEVIRLCNEALTYLNKDDLTNTLVKGDLVYKGNRDQWIKFVYAILARNAHHLSNKATYSPDQVIGYVDKAMVDNNDNFNIPHLGTNSNDANFFGPMRNNMGSYRQSKFMVSLLDGTVFSGIVDPRLSVMMAKSQDGVYRGLTNGAGNTFGTGAQAIPSLSSNYIFKDNANYPLFTYSEMQFMKSEAAYKKGDMATAYTAFINGISAHMDFSSIGTASKAAYLSSAAVPQNQGALTLKDILLQKYISMFGHGILETWVDMRRYQYDPALYTGFSLPTPLFAENNGSPAYRARPRYNSEYVWNLKSLEAIGATALDYHTKKPWFILP